MKYRIFYFLFLFLMGVAPGGQAQGDNRSIYALAGPAGNYLYLVLPAAGQPYDSARVAATDYYLIERAAYDSAGGAAAYKEIGRSLPVQSGRELRRFFDERGVAELQQAYNLSNEAALVAFFQSHRNPADYGMYYLLLPTKMATGDVYLDRTAKAGATYSYRATRVSRGGVQEPLGTAVVKTGAPNRLLDLFHPRQRSVSANDTVIAMSWKMPVDSLVQRPPAGIRPDMLAFVADGLKARVMVNDGTGYKLAEELLATGNDSEKTRNLIYRQLATPERQYNAYVLLQDEVGNTALPSDTLVAFSVGPNNMPKLGSLRTRAVLDGVKLSWPPVKPKPYIVAVKIMRYSDNDKGVEVGTVPPTDTSFVDYNVEPGTSYRYFAELLFRAGTGLEEIAPAQAVGAATEFSDPLPPFNIRIRNVGQHIRLDWDAHKQASIFGYYIYRGTSAKNLELIAGPVRGQAYFTDTAQHLSGRTDYFYAVEAQNYRQKTSPMSEPVSIRPLRAIETTSPKNLAFFYSGRSLYITFPDVREDDNAIVGYVVRGKEKGAASFRFRSGLLREANTVDSLGFAKGSTYQYQVAAVSMRGDTTAYSGLYEFSFPKDPVDQIGSFYVRNTSGGVMLSWGAVMVPGRKAYNVYRRSSADSAFTKLATVPADQFSYTDAATTPDYIYVYSISVTESDDREGERSAAKSIRREPVKATTISE